MKRYVEEPGSDTVLRLLQKHPACTSRLSEVEITSALARREREGSLEAGERDRALSSMTLDMDRLYVVELDPEIAAVARRLLQSYHLRAGDAIQLGSAVYLRAQTGGDVLFVGFDSRLGDAALGCGLKVFTALP